MTSNWSLILICINILYNLIHGNINNDIRHHFRYKGWGWTPNLPFLPKEINHYKDKRMITPGCNITLKNATFDLSPLHLSKQSQLKYYTVKDERSESDDLDNYEYAFNVCGAVLEIPKGCTNESIMGSFCEDNNINQTSGQCNNPPGLTKVNGPVFAYQMKLDENNEVTRCWHLSDTVGGPGIWSLLNEDNPAEGVTVSYLDGDYEPACGHNRQINISFVCDNDHGAFGIPGQAKSEIDYSTQNLDPKLLTTLNNLHSANIVEEEICQYKLEFHTVYGCPSQCPILGGKLCNGVGLCGYDNTLMQPRCYCLTYFTGEGCKKIDMSAVFKPKHDPITANLSSPFVKKFEHKLQGPGKKQHEVDVVYDLSEFHTTPDKPYIVNDIDGITHTYVWKFMGELDFDIVIDTNRSNKTLADLGCNVGLGYCKDLNGECDPDKSGDFVGAGGYVYQVDFENEQCVIAGGKNVSWELYDGDNPARGVVLTYHNGEYCSGISPFDGKSFKQNRKFKITLLCPQDTNAYIPLNDEKKRVFDAFVEEDDFNFCNYHVTITTAFACPDECLTDATNTPDIKNDVSVCNAKGMCASDPFSGYVHCLCDTGWTGDYCSIEYVAPPLPFKYKNQGSYIAAIVIISVLLVIICYFGYKKITLQKQKVKELEIKLVNYQSSGGGIATYHDERPPQLDEMPQAKGPSLGDKIKNKFSKNKKGKYSNISAHDNDDEQELFNVKVKMNGGNSDSNDDSNEENDDDKRYNKQQHIIGDDEDSNDTDGNEDGDQDQDQ
eukprot:319382_1